MSACFVALIFYRAGVGEKSSDFFLRRAQLVVSRRGYSLCQFDSLCLLCFFFSERLCTIVVVAVSICQGQSAVAVQQELPRRSVTRGAQEILFRINQGHFHLVWLSLPTKVMS